MVKAVARWPAMRYVDTRGTWFSSGSCARDEAVNVLDVKASRTVFRDFSTTAATRILCVDLHIKHGAASQPFRPPPQQLHHHQRPHSRAHLEAGADHPPAHQALGAAHEEQQRQAAAQRAVDQAARRKVGGGQRHHQACYEGRRQRGVWG